jgi:alpha-beta hydrolase superfamily lysophospholipase
MTEFLDIDGGRIAYDVTGEGSLVVLAHGMGDNRNAYRFLVPLLAEAGYRVANTDLRGQYRVRPARADQAPGRSRGHRRPLVRRRRGHHRGGSDARTGDRGRGDLPVHPRLRLA